MGCYEARAVPGPIAILNPRGSRTVVCVLGKDKNLWPGEWQHFDGAVWWKESPLPWYWRPWYWLKAKLLPAVEASSLKQR